VSRRTETAYKAQSAGKLAQHNKAPGSADRVNAAVVQRQFTHLIWGGLPDVAVAVFGSALYGNMQGDRAGVSRGHSRRRTLPKGGQVTGNEPRDTPR